MQHAEAFRTFSSGCERLIFSIKTNPPLTEDDARVIAHYCKEVLNLIAPCLPPNRPSQNTPR
jgi:hypothetical protein